VWLKWSGNPEKQAHAQSLSGKEAKRFGRDARNNIVEYDGTTIRLGSPEHHDLIKRAIRAKLEEHPDLAQRFTETRDRPLIHQLRGPENPNTHLPAAVFTRILSELRLELRYNLSPENAILVAAAVRQQTVTPHALEIFGTRSPDVQDSVLRLLR